MRDGRKQKGAKGKPGRQKLKNGFPGLLPFCRGIVIDLLFDIGAALYYRKTNKTIAGNLKRTATVMTVQDKTIIIKAGVA